MKKLHIICLLLLVGFSTCSFAVASKITLNFYGLREKGNYEPFLLKSNANITVKCERSLAKYYFGKVDIYSVSYDGFQTCNAAEGKLLGSTNCGLNHQKNTKALDFVKKEGETYYLIGFARKKNQPHKRVLSGGTCKSLGTKLIVHFCDPALNPNGKPCTMKSCPLSLGLGDGRIKDGQMSASSQLDKNRAAKQGRASLRSSSHARSWCASPTFDLRSQYLQVDLLSVHAVSAVSTQGAVAEKSWVSSYLVRYSLDGKEWIGITDKKGKTKEFKGNLDQSSLVRHWLKPPVNARFVRFVPLEWVGRRCMRVELHGCEKTGASLKKLSPKSCNAAHCADVPYSTCFVHNGKPLCKCVPTCALDLGIVCGTDGVTYQNECELKKTACLGKKRISISKHHPCSATTQKPKSSCNQGCPKVMKRVCGSDNVSYDNKCLLEKRACETNKEITVVKKGRCEAIIHESKSSCIQDCPKTIKQVCGSDNVTYDNKCLLEKTACEKKEGITIVKNGRCQESVTCERKCTAPYSRCVNRNGTEESCECVEGCPKILKRVCGSDNVIYDNKCLLEKTACEMNKEITVVEHGTCSDAVFFRAGLCGSRVCPPYSKCQSAELCVCPKCVHDGKEVCGSDGNKYNDFCKLQKVACESNTTLKLVVKGSCEAPLRKAGSGSTEHKEKNSTGSLKTFFVCMGVMGILGIAIALAMCMFQPSKSRSRVDRRKRPSRQEKKSFTSLHQEYRIEDYPEENK